MDHIKINYRPHPENTRIGFIREMLMRNQIPLVAYKRGFSYFFRRDRDVIIFNKSLIEEGEVFLVAALKAWIKAKEQKSSEPVTPPAGMVSQALPLQERER